MNRIIRDPSREELEQEEDRRLAPYAMRSARASRRLPLDREGRAFDYRTEFQRDRDRILHSRAFRRLRLKSHGGAIPPAERYRDRLTHTLEVAQLSRTVARGLGLNEDLVEAIALGHELGTPPFGRAGEEALARLLGPEGGGFRYNYQSLRVVDRLEKRYEHAGINLTDATREGILKHAAYDDAAPNGAAEREAETLHLDWAPFFEAQVVTAMDLVASVVQDLDDGLRSGDLEPATVEALPIVRELSRRIGDPVSRSDGGRMGRGRLFSRANTINRGLTHMMVTGVIHQSKRALKSWTREHNVESHEAFLASRPNVRAGTVGLTPRGRRLYDGLRDFLARTLHHGASLSGVASRARQLIGGLFRAITEDPRLAEDYLLLRFKEERGGAFLRDLPASRLDDEIARRYHNDAHFARLVADHIAGMTDSFAISEHDRLLGPFRAVMGAS